MVTIQQQTQHIDPRDAVYMMVGDLPSATGITLQYVFTPSGGTKASWQGEAYLEFGLHLEKQLQNAHLQLAYQIIHLMTCNVSIQVAQQA